jgi:hypothetical protein
MKKLLNPYLFFFLGFMAMATVQLLTRCEKYTSQPSDPINPSETSMNIDLKAINQAGATIESALLSADQSAVNKLVFGESAGLYLGDTYAYSPDELATIGSAFKNRQLTTSTENFAEFTYTISGKAFSLTIGRDEEGTWKIIRY